MPAKRKSPIKVGLNISDQAPSAFKSHDAAADQVALEVVNHVDQQYPAMWDKVPKTARVSLRNFVYNQVLLAIGNAARSALTEPCQVAGDAARRATVIRTARPPGTLIGETEARAAAAKGSVILAIKILNNSNGICLKEAKDIVESWLS